METEKKEIGKIQDHTIHTMEKFQEIISKECSRCDRNSRSFSLILFGIGKFSANGNGDVDHLLGIIASRTRGSDEIGWYDNSCLGVLLPDTNMNGSKNFADQILSIAKENEIRTSYSIISYPSFGWNSFRN